MSAPTAHLVVVSGLPPAAVELTPGAFATAGRAPDAHLLLADVGISRHHCRFVWNGERCTVEDLGSVRGTRVNGTTISGETEIRPGDKIAIGPAVVEFGLGPAPEISSAQTVETERAAPMLVKGLPSDRLVPADFGGELVIGRDPEGDVVLNDPGVSRKHANVRVQPGGGCVISDLHSTAGTFVNGRRFDTHELTVGDRIQIGPFHLEYDGLALVRVVARGSSIMSMGVTQKAGEQLLLDDVTFTLPASHFAGIIGPSGAGKSTLLQTLAGLRKPFSGVVLADAEDIYGEHLPIAFGYVPQEDIVHTELSVDQALRFGARLRLSASTPAAEIEKLIAQTADQLGLSERRNHRISKLSGGQRKRVSVGVELLARPAILFLDEPSSGLDPATEFHLMELLRRLADTGTTIICTTHVMENAYLMDRLLVLCAGSLVYEGPAQEARRFFSVGKLTSLYDKLQERPPKDWKGEFLAAKAERGNAALDEPAAGAKRTLGRVPLRKAAALPILLTRQLLILLSDWRNPIILLLQPIVIAALVAWVTDDRSLALFFAYLTTLWFGCSNAAQEIVKERAIFERERLIGVGVHSYLGGKFVFLTVITAVQALLFYGCVVGFEGKIEGDPLWQVFGILGTALAGTGIGCAISAHARSVMQAVFVVPLVIIPQILFSGYTVPAHEMTAPVYNVSRALPSFAAQTTMDTSFIWQQKIARSVLSDRFTSFRNLNRDGSIKTGEVFAKPEPGVFALFTQLVWGLLTYVLAWVGLRPRQ